MAERDMLYQFTSNIQSHQDNKQIKENTLEVQFGKIKFLEYGFDIGPQDTSEKLTFDVYDQTYTTITCKIRDSNNLKRSVDVNDKRSPKTKLGYNQTGGDCCIVTLDGQQFQPEAWNPVLIYTIDDTDLFDKNYWWGREDNTLYAYLNEIYKSVFYIFIPKINQLIFLMILLLFFSCYLSQNYLNKRELITTPVIYQQGFPGDVLIYSQNAKKLITNAYEIEVLYFAYQVPDPLAANENALKYLIVQFQNSVTEYYGAKYQEQFFPSHNFIFIEEYVTPNLQPLLNQFQIAQLPNKFSNNYPNFKKQVTEMLQKQEKEEQQNQILNEQQQQQYLQVLMDQVLSQMKNEQANQKNIQQTQQVSNDQTKVSHAQTESVWNKLKNDQFEFPYFKQGLQQAINISNDQNLDQNLSEFLSIYDLHMDSMQPQELKELKKIYQEQYSKVHGTQVNQQVVQQNSKQQVFDQLTDQMKNPQKLSQQQQQELIQKILNARNDQINQINQQIPTIFFFLYSKPFFRAN